MSWLNVGELGPMGPRSDRYGTYGLGMAAMIDPAVAGAARSARLEGSVNDPARQVLIDAAVRAVGPTESLSMRNRRIAMQEAERALKIREDYEKEQAARRQREIALVEAAQAKLRADRAQKIQAAQTPVRPATLAPAQPDQVARVGSQSQAQGPLSLSVGPLNYSSGIQTVDSWRPLGIVLGVVGIGFAAYVAFR